MTTPTAAGAATDELHRLIENPPDSKAAADEWREWFTRCAWAATPKRCSGGGCRSGRHGSPGCGQNQNRGYRLAELAMPAALRLILARKLRGDS